MRTAYWMPGLLTGLLLSCTLITPVMAASKPAAPDPNAPACVDFVRLFGEYPKTSGYAKYEQRLKDQDAAFAEEMQGLAKLRYCTAGERAEVSTLKLKTKQTDAEKARLAELEGQAEKLDAEFTALSQKTNPTPDDSKRIQALSKMRTDAARELSKQDQARQEKMQELKTELGANVRQELTKLIEKVAKELKVAAVYDREAVLFGGNEITDEVIKKLPK